MKIFDPDRVLIAPDKAQHLASGALLANLMLAIGLSPLQTLAWSLAIGATYEMGQLDIAHSLGVAGTPGYGFGLLDLAMDMLGAAIPVARFALYCAAAPLPLPSHPVSTGAPTRLALSTTSSGVRSSHSVAILPQPESAPPAVPRRSSP